MTTLLSTHDSSRQSTAEVCSFVNEIERVYLLERLGFENDRRAAERLKVTMPVVVSSLDEDFQPLDHQCHAVTRDISRLGIGMVATSPVSAKYVRLEITPYHRKPFSVIARVVYCNAVGYYFQLGCEFLS